MPESNRTSALPPAMGSTTSTKTMPATSSSGTGTLSASEIKSLRQEFKAAYKVMDQYLAAKRQR